MIPPSFYNVDDLVGAIDEYLNQHNASPKPFIWTASATDILAKVKRARKALNMAWAVWRGPLAPAAVERVPRPPTRAPA